MGAANRVFVKRNLRVLFTAHLTLGLLRSTGDGNSMRRGGIQPGKYTIDAPQLHSGKLRIIERRAGQPPERRRLLGSQTGTVILRWPNQLYPHPMGRGWAFLEGNHRWLPL